MEQKPLSARPLTSGHRGVPHTADLRIEAWADTREECVAEAVRALVNSFAEPAAQSRRRAVKRHVAGETDADLVAAAIEEVIYRLDTRGEIPVAVAARRAADGGIDLTLHLADLDQAEITGAVPKAASLSGLRCGQDETGRWSCAVTIDV